MGLGSLDRSALGNGLTWPSRYDGSCDHYWQEGFTRYPHKGATNGAKAPYNEASTNGYLRGVGTFSFCDGHAKAMRNPEAEKCIAGPQPFITGSNGSSHTWTKYYPYWVTDF